MQAARNANRRPSCLSCMFALYGDYELDLGVAARLPLILYSHLRGAYSCMILIFRNTRYQDAASWKVHRKKN